MEKFRTVALPRVRAEHLRGGGDGGDLEKAPGPFAQIGGYIRRGRPGKGVP
jgi:hypothetical protein